MRQRRTMRQRGMAVQEDLFAPEGPKIPMSAERRERLIGLVGALILEVMTNPDAAAEGGDHDADHD